MKNPFTLSWGKPNAAAEMPKFQEIPAGETLSRLSSYAETVLKLLRNNDGQTNYGEAAVKRLSDDVNRSRLQYNDEAKVKIANMYGCFLGTSIIQSYGEFKGRWVQSDEGVGIFFASSPGTIRKIAFPITRVFKQIDHGEEFSIYSFFMAIPEFVSAQPRA